MQHFCDSTREEKIPVDTEHSIIHIIDINKGIKSSLNQEKGLGSKKV